MKRNTAKEWRKIVTREHFNLYQSAMEPCRWQVRSSPSAGYVRRRFHAPNLESALAEAPRVLGIVRGESGGMAFTLAESFAMALEHSSRGERAREDWIGQVEKFLVWLKRKHPLCTHWERMTRQILREYLAVYDRKSANYRRLSVQPILQTAGFMHREYGCPNIGERLGIGNKLKTTPKAVYLEDVLSFCDWLRENRPYLEVGACLQGLAGLQLLEALRLTWDRVDLERGLVEVSGEVKNEYRNRVIPVSTRVVEALYRASVRRRTAKLYSGVVLGDKGRPYEDFCSYSRLMGKAITRWNTRCEWAPKDLRNCLPTFAIMEGIHGAIWEQYIGHSPKTITERHYVPRLGSGTHGEEAALARQVELFGRLVVAPIEEAFGRQVCKI